MLAKLALPVKSARETDNPVGEEAMNHQLWRRAAWISGGLAAVLTASATWTALQSAGDRLVWIAAATVAATAGIWWLVAAGLCKQRRWAAHLGTGAGVLNLLQGLAAG